MAEESVGEIYARLRRQGKITLSADDRGRVSSLRRLAAKDGLKISQFTPRHRQREGFLRRAWPLSVSLVHPSNPTTVVRPDAPAGEIDTAEPGHTYVDPDGA